MNLETARAIVLLLGAVGCFIWAFVSSNPTWIGTGSALLGGEFLVRARKQDDK